mmetsp:Transcript_33102/g.34414  ORF Transcript_33102/g.34414 Transcript_33102/m.34414 type:complete len:115 (-) Transcript_33102:103-447(-)
MSSIFSQDVLEQESAWFTSQTSLFDQTNSVQYDIPQEQLDKLKSQFFSNRSELLHLPKSANDNVALENIMRRCFKKCNKFVLEDWVEFDELDCTLKCASVHKQSYEALKSKAYL